MFEENAVNEAQEQVVDAQTPAEVTSEVVEQPAEGTPEAAQTTEPPAKAPQTQEENSQFAQQRRRYEQMLRQQKQESEAAMEGYSGLMNTLKGMGYEGTPEEVANLIEAQQKGVTVEQVRAQKAADQARAQQLMERDPRYQQAISEAERYREIVKENIRSKDAAAINAAFPEAKVGDPRDLGEQFMALRKAGVDAVTAYANLQMAKAATAKPVPPDMGAVNGTETKDSEFFDENELDALTEKQLRDPKILAKAKRSIVYLFGPK